MLTQCCAKAGDRVSCSLITTAASGVTTLPGVPVGTGLMTKQLARAAAQQIQLSLQNSLATDAADKRRARSVHGLDS